MLKHVASTVWAFDVEWVPDPETGRLALGLEGSPDDIVVEHMWAEERSRSNSKETRPSLPTPLCRVVSVAAVVRNTDRDGTTVRLTSLPKDTATESQIIERFLQPLQDMKPQLVGWSSIQDIHILAQRAMRYGHSYRGLHPPEKPWEGLDYFSNRSDAHVDLMDCCFGWGRKASLHEMAACMKIPGKQGTSGADVYDLWTTGSHDQIRRYCETDAITTYLVWLRAAHFVGLLGGLLGSLQEEEGRVDEMLEEGGEAHLLAYLEAWRAMR